MINLSLFGKGQLSRFKVAFPASGRIRGTLSQASSCPVKILNPEPLEYEAEVVTTTQ
jgi:hypothetical protein